MTDITAARAEMETKQKLKHELIGKLKELNLKVNTIREEIKKEGPQGRGRKSGPDRIREQIDRLEFQIATSTFTLAQEKDLVRKVQALQAELKDALKNDEKSVKLDAMYNELRAGLGERDKIREQLDALSKELDKLYHEIIAAGVDLAHNREEQKERRESFRERSRGRDDRRRERAEERKEMEPYMKEHDPYVSLEEIAFIEKKKPAQEAE